MLTVFVVKAKNALWERKKGCLKFRKVTPPPHRIILVPPIKLISTPWIYASQSIHEL